MENQTITSCYNELGLNRILDSETFSLDVVEGVVRNPAQTRVVYFSEDIIKGVHAGLVEETGPAWTTIMQNCGRLWGERLSERLDRELSSMSNTSLGELPIGDFNKYLQNYFSIHGFGKLLLDVGLTQEHGIVICRLENSFFAQVLRDEKGMVDFLLAGTLEVLISKLSNHDLGCIEVASERRGDECGVFLISSSNRIAKLEPLVESGEDVDTCIKALIDNE
ncbi:MAG: hypothetical protein AAFX93_18335 [Verrucomicrobiota bacterium]